MAQPGLCAIKSHHFQCVQPAEITPCSFKLGLHVSWSKTKVQNLGHGAPVSSLHVNGELVEAVTSFCYLGSTQTSGANSSPDATRRIGIASTAMNRLDRIWRQGNISDATKFCLYSCCILSVLLYGCESWTLTSSEWRKLESFHMRCQRRILNIRWFDFTRNADVREISGQEHIEEVVRRRRLRFFGHVARTADDVPAKTILRTACDIRDGAFTQPGWQRSRGRPPTSWMQQIISDTGLGAGLAVTGAQDRSMWRTYATASEAMR